jgi:predicted ferric reductase
MNQAFKRILATFVALIPVFILIGIWLLMAPLSTRFADTQTALLSLGRISGLVGLALYALSLVLHVRIRFLNKIGIDNQAICRLHHDFGSWALILLLIHPLALALRYATVNLYVAAKFLVPLDNFTNFLGLLALLIMIAAILVTYYYKNNHTFWLWIHRSMLVAYVASFVHLLLVTSDTSTSPALKYYLVFLMAAGIIAFAYQRLIRYFPTTKEAPEAC